MGKLFGTDGMRAVAGQFPLEYSAVYMLGKTLIKILHEKGLPPKVIIGRDTRESGEWIEQAMIHGIQDYQGEAISAGVIPTSAISYLTKKHPFSSGVVISASHNPYQYNGIKIFSHDGLKIPDNWEDTLETALKFSGQITPKKNIEIKYDSSLSQEYIDFLKTRFSMRFSPRKIKIICDCSNGTSSFFAPRVLSDLGFDVTPIYAEPNGKNINAGCGSMHPENLAKEVVEHNADIGIAYDGDADRAFWIDEKGKILNGDYTLLILAQFFQKQNKLKSDYIVATTMSNLGLEKALEKLHIKLFRTQVGDKYVLEQMIRLQANLGGEQSGHTIILDECPTGDGILTSIKMLETMVSMNAPLSTLAEGLKEYPQVLKNVPISHKEDLKNFSEITKTITHIKQRLADKGRLNVRFSGTEPVVRIMVEGENLEEINKFANEIADSISKHLGKL